MPENTVDTYHLTLSVESTDQGTSLAEYMTRHGVEAHLEPPDAVVIPVEEDQGLDLIKALHKGWKLFWRHSDAELFGEPVYIKPGCAGAECPTRS